MNLAQPGLAPPPCPGPSSLSSQSSLSSLASQHRPVLLAVVLAAHVLLLAALLQNRPSPLADAALPIVVDLISLPALKPMAPPQAEAKPRSLPRPQPLPQATSRPQAAPLPTSSQAPTSVLTPTATPSTPAAATAPAAAPAAVAPPASAAEALAPARFDADYLKNPAPPYPPLSRRMREEGKVVLRVQVSAQGTADSVEIKQSSGSSRLDEAALKTVRDWKFVPAKRGDAPVASAVLVPIHFKLEQ